MFNIQTYPESKAKSEEEKKKVRDHPVFVPYVIVEKHIIGIIHECVKL